MNHFSFSTLIFFYRNNSVAPINQLLACLRLYATEGHLDQIADYMGMHLATVSRIVVRVSEAIAQLYNVYVGFPNTENDIRTIQKRFYDVAAFPELLGPLTVLTLKCSLLVVKMGRYTETENRISL
jgi:hypothetical protein